METLLGVVRYQVFGIRERHETVNVVSEGQKNRGGYRTLPCYQHIRNARLTEFLYRAFGPRRLRPLDLAYVGPLGHQANEVLESLQRFLFRRNEGLDVSRLAVLEDERGSAKGSMRLYRFFMVPRHDLNQRRVFQVLLELGNIQPGFLGDLYDGVVLIQGDPFAAMPRSQQCQVESVEGLISLSLGSLTGHRSQQRASLVQALLLPDLPVVAFLVIYLLQREVLPGDVKIIAESILNSIQPHGCIVDIGSSIVEIDIYVYLIQFPPVLSYINEVRRFCEHGRILSR